MKFERVRDNLLRYVNPPIDSQVLLFHGTSEKDVILHEEITPSQADTGSVVGSAGTHFSFCHFQHCPCAPEEKVFVEMGKQSSDGVLEQLFVVGEHGKTDEDAGKEADIEDEDVDVVRGAPALAISGFELQGFKFSEVVHRKRLEGQTSSEAVDNTARPPQCEFPNLHSSLAFGLLEQYGGHSYFP